MIPREFQGKVEVKAATMASVVSGSTGSLVSSGSSTGTNEDCVINEDHFSSSCSSLELEDIQEVIEGVGSCFVFESLLLCCILFSSANVIFPRSAAKGK